MTRRIARTFSQRIRSQPAPAWLAVILGALLIEGAWLRPVHAQAPMRQTTRRPSFDVALIIPTRSRGAESSEPAWGEFVARDVTTRYLIEYAYDINQWGRASDDELLQGGPDWINYEKYDVDAKVDDALAKRMRKFPPAEMQEQMRLMLQSLLADQFSLKVHREPHDRPVYALTVAEGGPKFLQTRNATSSPGSRDPDPDAKTVPPSSAGAHQLSLQGSMGELAAMLSQNPDVDRQVIDRTGLEGKYECLLEWGQPAGHGHNNPKAREAAGGDPASDGLLSSDPPEAPIFAAIQEQLGLKLEPATGSVDVLIIDYIERPSGN